MSKPTRQEVHSLYRSYLRIVREWPEDKVRPNRGMKQILAKRVEEQFKTPKATESLDLEEARKELDALESLLDNTFKDKVILSVNGSLHNSNILIFA
jgi:ribosome-binding protein aMBF1 (putative translation factor)